MKSHMESRLRQLDKGVGVDWATAEALAIGSLLLNGNIMCNNNGIEGTFDNGHHNSCRVMRE